MAGSLTTVLILRRYGLALIYKASLLAGFPCTSIKVCQRTTVSCFAACLGKSKILNIRASSVTKQILEPHEEMLQDPCLSALDIVRSTSSEAAFSRVSSWVADCVARHDRCRLPNPNFVPHRLVNVGSWS